MAIAERTHDGFLAISVFYSDIKFRLFVVTVSQQMKLTIHRENPVPLAIKRLDIGTSQNGTFTSTRNGKTSPLSSFALAGFAIFVTKVSVFITCVIVVTGALRLLHALLSVVPHLSGTSATWQAFSGAF